MILYLNLLMVLFLLQYQNCMAEGNQANTGTTSIIPSSSPILIQSQTSATTTALTTNSTQSDFQSNTSDGFTPPPFSASKDPLLASTSSAVSSTLTPTSTFTLSSSTGVSQESSSFTHAPYTNKDDLTPTPNSSADSTARTPSYEGNTTSGSRNTSDFHTTISPTANFSISPTPIGKMDSNCSHIKPRIIDTYEDISEISVTVMIEHMTNEELNFTLNCNRDFTKQNETCYTFLFDQCTDITVTCNFIERPCINDITFPVQIPLYDKNFNLKPEAGQTNIIFKWNNTSLLDKCQIEENYNCTDQNNSSKKYTAHGPKREVTGLEPYTGYNCTAMLIYKKKTIINKLKHILTKAGKPGKIMKLRCSNSTDTSITIMWEKPEILNGPLPDYKQAVESKGYKNDTKTSKETFQTFGNLLSYKNYSLYVKAFNEELHGEAEKITCQTRAGKPGTVTKKHRKLIENNGIDIKCDYEGLPKGPKRIFHLEYSGVTMNQTHCHFRILNLNYLTQYTFKISLYNGEHYGPPKEFVIKTKYNDKALIGFLVFFIIITALALLLVLGKIYKLQRGSSSQCESLPLVNQDDEKHLMNIDPIPVELLLDTYKKKNADEGRLFLDEFQSIPRVFSKFSIKEARKSCNQSKNRYIDILPYDDNRVVLSEIQGEPGSDYINASYINGFKEPRKYIAAQGPKNETIYDFWRMVWEQKSTIIVMVTRCEEGNRNKCAQYWPSMEDEFATYNEIVVKITGEKIFPDYITRKLHINNERERSERDVTHIQFTVWPDHGVPDDPNLLLKLRRRVNALSNFFSGPIIVHCSAGVGRTGTYVSIDAMLEGLEAENRVDVYGYVVQLRRQRCLMVQVESQYIFIHKCLVEYSQFGETEISIPELPNSLNNLKTCDPPSEPSQLESEFQRIPSYRNWRQQKVGNDQSNKDLNRNPKIVPYDYNRVQIKLEEEQSNEENEEESEYSSDEGDTEDGTKYINASYIIGFWGTRAIIATQGPLENTVSDFWQMIFQKKVKAIVTLSAPSQENKAACFPYWEKKKETYEDLEVELTNEKSCGSFTERTFEITYSKKTDKRTVCQFHYEQWVEELPGNSKELLNMVEKIRKEFPDKGVEEPSKHDKSSSLVVHCSDGSQQTGTFCALWNLLESAAIEGVIDVFQTVKNIRKQRTGMVYSLKHYQLLYDIIASTVPAQNGQIKTPIRQEDTVVIQNELAVKAPVEKESEKNSVQQEDEVETKPKEDESTSNGPTAAPFTEVTLRIDE
ncbi:receptor-type tyrosine-protein phosphatase C isoform X3 [Xenopus laevis]|uniref:Receptor-type tyrosine-protein phosphatase C n=1 Tax=Xenopus laevis TaxID=8355 RepID=A0A8J1MZ26_XENLA|nr:receptor-type tyrosine-protein phosphatase C isoform X3 [Xenopus laevis]